MATSTQTEPDAAAPAFTCSLWDVNNTLVRVDRTGEPMPSVQVRHLAYPYVCELVTATPSLTDLLPLAYRYLVAVNPKLGLAPQWLDALQPPGHQPPTAFGLAWLVEPGNPAHSCWIERAGAAGDRTAVLLAGIFFDIQKMPLSLFFNGGQGIRILAQVSAVRHGRVSVRITGVVSTVPVLPADYLVSEPARLTIYSTIQALASKASLEMPQGVALVDGGITLRRVSSKRADPLVTFELTAKTAVAIVDPQTTIAAPDSMQLGVTSHKLTITAGDNKASLQPLITFATSPAHAFVLVPDPVSQTGSVGWGPYRPNRPSTTFRSLRSRQFLGHLPSIGGGKVELNDTDVRVRHVRLVDVPIHVEGTPYAVSADSDAGVRRNEFAAVSAFHHLKSMFRRMRNHGLPSAAYFRFANLPLDVHYRAGIVPGFADGRTVNAQVRWTITAGSQALGAQNGQLSPWNNPAASRTLELRFALGDLQMSAGRLPVNIASATEREPLGVAADLRWCWHEFGHVLIAAATGELELPFAHSVGDALAAVECDPQSRLACHPDGSADNSGNWRHATFPWVFIPRRHDRDVQRGWSWTETVCGVGAPHGYRSEQLMSTSLFRLYRALGGDCVTAHGNLLVPDVPARDQASAYTSYLIMRTLASLGPANVSPCTSVHQFVHTMRTVDSYTTSTAGPGGYIGGTANKVIQWTFERQGMYGVPVPGSLVMGPESNGTAAPRVDLHLTDQRVQTDGPYTPLNLLADTWQAAPDTIRIRAVWGWLSWRRSIRVRVDNRGADVATQATVQVWVARCITNGAIPPFPDPAVWTLVGSRSDTVPGCSGSTPGSRRFGRIYWLPPAKGQYAVLASASCPADRSNVDPATMLPCASQPGPTARLVAFDNNLALTLVTI